jgi:hypothetical protein
MGSCPMVEKSAASCAALFDGLKAFYGLLVAASLLETGVEIETSDGSVLGFVVLTCGLGRLF